MCVCVCVSECVCKCVLECKCVYVLCVCKPAGVKHKRAKAIIWQCYFASSVNVDVCTPSVKPNAS
jgi:hypothetical protein